jgi:hypothetical protein
VVGEQIGCFPGHASYRWRGRGGHRGGLLRPRRLRKLLRAANHRTCEPLVEAVGPEGV